jgi:transmembrane sensor
LVREHASKSRRRLFALTGSVAAVLIGAIAVWKVEQAVPDRFETVVGGLEAVPLADGSRVTLNTDSEVQVSLAREERVVNLNRGEAYFEVAKEPRRPFVVNAGNRRVVAVGTQFSVRRDGDTIQVIVTEGTVRMEDRRARGSMASTQSPTSGQIPTSTSSSAPGSAESATPGPAGSAGSGAVVLLPAGSVARAEADAVLVQKKPRTEIEQQLSWRSGLLTFRDTPLADAVAEFNRYNERKIVIEDPRIASLQLGGVFRSTNIDPFIELLERGFPVRATQEANRIVLTHN